MSLRYRSSAPCSWVQPRQPLDASRRFQVHGPILPMDQPKGLLAKVAGIFGRGRI